MAHSHDDFRDLRWLLRILNRSSLEARYPEWRATHSDASLPCDDEARIDDEEDEEPRIVRVAAAVADDAA